MPRDPSGNYTLPALGNPAVTNTPITIAWWNGTSTDMASAFTDSLSRSGQGGMLGPFGAVDGTAGAPGLTFQSETNLGFYRFGAGEMNVVVGGTRYSRWTVSGFQESFDSGATWKTPAYLDVAAQSMGSTGALDFAAGKLSIGSLPVPGRILRSTTSTGSFSTANTSYTAVTNANISFTATGGPVQVQLVADDTSSAAQVFANSSVNGGPSTSVGLQIALSTDGGSTFFAIQQMGAYAVWTGIGAIYVPSSTYPPAGLSTWYTPSAGAATLGVYVKCIAANQTANVSNCKLLIHY